MQTSPERLNSSPTPEEPRPGAEYWRSLEELADSEEFQKTLAREFPNAAHLLDGVDRRRFLKLMGASLALAGVGGCGIQPAEWIVPFVRPPEEATPGEEKFYATAFELAGYATGVLVESHEGRPTKVEGNPLHPASHGATDAYAQASVLSLYDPDRSRVVNWIGRLSTWDAFASAMRAEFAARRAAGGAGVRLLTGTVTSPALAAEIRRFLQALPAAQWHQWEPLGRHAVKEGSRLAFGRPLEPQYRFAAAEVVVSLGAHIFGNLPGGVRYARDFIGRRKAAGTDPAAFAGRMSRLWVVETTPTSTGAIADERLALKPSQIPGLARAIAASLGVGPAAGAPPLENETASTWAQGVVADLAAHRGASIVIAGEEQPAEVHALAHAINEVLGNAGQTVVYTEPVEAEPVDQVASIRSLVDDMNAGAVEALIILGANPVYTAPADLDFAQAMDAVRLRIHHGLYQDETAALCHWHIPALHYLEGWADSRAFDGAVSIVQPLIQPLYAGRSAFELLPVFSGAPERTAQEAVRAHWQSVYTGGDFERFWEQCLSDGVVEGTALAPQTAPPVNAAALAARLAAAPAADGLEIAFQADPSVFDGSFANNAWLQELPRPISKLTWSNAVFLSPATAARLELANGDVVELDLAGRQVRGAVWIQPGQAADAATVHLGYGRRQGGAVAAGAGFDAYPLRGSGGLHFVAGAGVRRTGESSLLVSTQAHHAMEGRGFVREAALDAYVQNPEFVHEGHPVHDISLYPSMVDENRNQWGMSIDLGSCMGCNACVIACQAENNIPVVGAEQVARGREMHWLRIDSYYAGDAEDPQFSNQPVPCMHCEKAPCEPVCPVGATVHSHEGLNEMVYNRCVGTRYCSNNCPYKVRRFNFFNYTDYEDRPLLAMLSNPDVTIRTRGVMEKCTYCVQRISRGRIRSKLEGRPLRDGEIVTACQQVCPTEAIVFGDVADPETRVSALKQSPLNYALLGDLGVRPRTTYLGRVRNPFPAAGAADAEA